MRKSDQEKQEAVARLHELLKPGSRVYSIIRHVSRSGMQREISLVVVDSRDAEHPLTSIDWLVARALGYRIGKHGGLVVGGCGMDMAYHLVHNLGRTMWPKGTDKPHGRRNGQPDTDGGYALKHEAL